MNLYLLKPSDEWIGSQDYCAHRVYTGMVVAAPSEDVAKQMHPLDTIYNPDSGYTKPQRGWPGPSELTTTLLSSSSLVTTPRVILTDSIDVLL